MSVIEAKDVYFAYEKKPVINGISFSIAEAHLVGIVGPNGAGKSTLVNIINGQLIPQSGEVTIQGKRLEHYGLRQRARLIATVPQLTQIVFPYRVFDIVLMGRHPHLHSLYFESAEDIEITQQAIKMADIGQFAERNINELSGGERQLVIIARALAQDTPILLFDEPTASLDLKHQLLLFNLLAQMKADTKRTIVIVSHDINLSAMFCDHLLLMKDGKIIGQGKPEEVITVDNIQRAYDVEVDIIGDGDHAPYVRLKR